MNGIRKENKGGKAIKGNYGGEKKGGFGVGTIRPRAFLEYSCSCCMKPKFGFAILLLFLMKSIACVGVHP